MAIHISVGTDLQGDANLYLQRLNESGDGGDFLTAAELNNRLEDIQEAVGWLFEPGGENPRFTPVEQANLRVAVRAYQALLQGRLPDLRVLQSDEIPVRPETAFLSSGELFSTDVMSPEDLDELLKNLGEKE